MKKLTLLVTLIIAAVTAFGQPAVKLYGYSQSQHPGMVVKESSGNGAKAEITVYFQSNTKDKINHTGLWVNGKKYSYRSENVKTPVIQINNIIPSKPVRTVLVPANGLKTVLLSELKAVTGPWVASTKLISSNAVVLQYEWKGKKYYKAVKKLIILEPITNE